MNRDDESLAELIDPHLRRLRGEGPPEIHPEVEKLSGLVPPQVDARAEHRKNLLQKHSFDT